MRLTDEQNIAFMNDPRRIAAQQELDSIRRKISENVKFDGTAMYYLSVLPPLLVKLEKAYENLNIVEATVQHEILKEGE